MPANTYPYAATNPGLRTCARCRSRVYHTAMCEKHSVCLTCEHRAGEMCGRPNLVSVKKIITLTDAEREAERAEVKKIVESLYGP